jgi:hypothetical protein
MALSRPAQPPVTQAVRRQTSFSMKSKQRHILNNVFALIISVRFVDLLFLLFGGEYLARQIMPPIPANSIVSDGFSQHTVLCKNIDYTTHYTPQEILEQWSTTISQRDNLKGDNIYHSEKCNESWLGLHYASFYKKREPACAIVDAWSVKGSNETHVFVQLSWSICPAVVHKYFPYAPYFQCFEG